MEWGSFLRRARTAGWAGGERAACSLLAAAALAPLPLAAQTTASADAQIQILDPVTAGAGADMDFGEITTAGSPGTVVIPASATNTSASCTTTGGLVHTGNCTAAGFDGDGSFLSVLQVIKPAGNQLTLTGPGGATMLVNNLTYAPTSGLINWFGSNATQHQFLIINGSGLFEFHVGGRLNVAGNQMPGTYTGTFTLTLNYN